MESLLEYLEGTKTNQNLQLPTESEQKSEESKTYTEDEVSEI